VPQVVSVPLYLQWSFWAVVVAVIAIVLSQLPPIYTLLRRAKLDMELYTSILLTHTVGNPNVRLHLILSNVGGRSIKVKGMTLKLKRDGKDVGVLPAETYYQDPGSKTTVLLTRFILKSRDEWAHLVIFLNYFVRADEKKYRNAESILKQEIAKKRSFRKTRTASLKQMVNTLPNSYPCLMRNSFGIQVNMKSSCPCKRPIKKQTLKRSIDSRSLNQTQVNYQKPRMTTNSEMEFIGTLETTQV
jgi:hypothetical protein